MNEFLHVIRENEKNSHLEIYSHARLYETEGWLKRPARAVRNTVTLLQGRSTGLKVLDLGCGIGRNCIYIAKSFSDIPCLIDCVDILEFAVQKLYENAAKFDALKTIRGYVLPIEQYEIEENAYDLILAVSALEHVENKASFQKKLVEIKKGTAKNGMVCLVINTEITEIEKTTKQSRPAQFEVNLSTEETFAMLRHTFSGWKFYQNTVETQKYDVPRKDGMYEITTRVISLIAQKKT